MNLFFRTAGVVFGILVPIVAVPVVALIAVSFFADFAEQRSANLMLQLQGTITYTNGTDTAIVLRDDYRGMVVEAGESLAWRPRGSVTVEHPAVAPADDFPGGKKP